MLFRREDVFKPITNLINGERARVLLTKIMLQKPDLIIMDEPTNNLDIASSDIIDNVLNEYKGTLLLISHDRYFVDSVCTKVWYLANQKLKKFNGNYSQFRTCLG
jgi:ATP-binding cassette subfamily F protein 3